MSKQVYQALASREDVNRDTFEKLFPDNIFLLTYRGSKTHGTWRPPEDPDAADDIDYIAGFYEDPSHYLGFPRPKRKLSVHKQVDPHDAVSHEIRKLFNLLLGANPNALPLLFCDEKHVIYQDDIGRYLREHGYLFLSKRAYHSFMGVARSFLEDFEDSVEGDVQFHGYMGEKRKKLVEEVGHDSKAAQHVIRYLDLLVEILEEGTLTIYRPQKAEFYLDIKRGEYPILVVEELIEEKMNEADQALENSTLPEKPDWDFAERLLMDILGDHLCPP